MQRHNLESHVFQVNALTMTQKILTSFWFYFILHWSKRNCWNFNFWGGKKKRKLLFLQFGSLRTVIILLHKSALKVTINLEKFADVISNVNLKGMLYLVCSPLDSSGAEWEETICRYWCKKWQRFFEVEGHSTLNWGNLNWIAVYLTEVPKATRCRVYIACTSTLPK